MALPEDDDRTSAGSAVTGVPSWSRVKEVIEQALERPPGERAGFVQQTCGDDRALRAEVESLLTAMEQAGSFVERPALYSLASSEPLAGSTTLVVRHALNPGDSLGPHEILAFVGAGGMGEVYRARDSRLNRDVALKVLPDAFAYETDRLARFRREAQVLASLNHPNIAAIYGHEESDRGQALVLELVDGPTLADRIAREPVPLGEALSIAKQIAEGLTAAHRLGIVHRDLKPANIKLRSDGTVKLLDFGLAKALSSVESAVASDAASAASSAMSRAGVIFGTAAYMSPEQALGRTVDERSDIWAFGCVVYEMITGRRAFRGETSQDTLAAVLLREPDWRALPAGVPPGVVRLLHRCLEKDVDRRLPSIADARIEVDDARVPNRIAIRAPRGRRVAWALAAAIVAVAAALWGLPGPSAPSRGTGPAMTRLLIGLPAAEPLARAASMPLGLGQPSIAIAPDGTRVAYVLERQGARQLYLRALDQFDAMPIPRTEGAFGPFFSPDGAWVGFFADNKLRKVAASGGTPITLCDAPNPYGGSWGTDGTILFAAEEGRRPARVRETGGVCQRIPIADDRGSWRQPDILPGGRAAIVTNPLRGVGILLLETGEFRLLVDGGSSGRYAPSGHLVFARPGALLAAPFDVTQLTLTGPEALILDDVRTDGVGATPQAAFSRTGTLVYSPGIAGGSATRPVWVDRQGNVEPLAMPPRTYRTFSLSPDGMRLAIVIADPISDLWVQDLTRGILTRLTSGAQAITTVRWTPDGTRVVFTSRGDRAATPSWVLPDGSGEPEPLFASDQQGAVTSFSPDGRLATLFRRDPATGLDLWVVPLTGHAVPQPFLRTRFTEAGATFSPDGRWIAYISDESGQYEVYVRPYPPGPGKWQVSTAGGVEGIWSRDGKELFYRNGQRWMVAPVNLDPAFTAETPRLLFEGPYANVGGLSYDVAPDGRRFLLLEPVGHDAAPVTHLNVVLNWFEDVRQKAGVGSREAR
jgi:eukaryotic-like serine/threonine-protein kinase